MSPSDTPLLVLLCQPGFGATLAEELAARLGVAGSDPRIVRGQGYVTLAALPGAALPKALVRPLIFERQRLFPAQPVTVGDDGPPQAEALAQAVKARYGARMAGYCCALHVYAVPEPAPKALGRLAERIAQSLDPVMGLGPGSQGDRAPQARTLPARAGQGGAAANIPELVLQVCVTAEGVFAALMAPQALSDPRPGGVHRARRDEAAPSRSALKIEEVLEALQPGPQPRQRVIDLGAAPGGWSHAFLKRGCRVLAVDNGPLKIPDLDELPGELTHLRADGMSFVPRAPWQPADWWLCDMLVPPGKTLGLLRRWVGGRWCRQFVVNVKLPQGDPLAALRPVEAYLASVPGLRYRVRHLFHDRHEVTVTGWLDVRPAGFPEAAPGEPGPRRQRPEHQPDKRRRPGAGRGRR